jgi:hypothetical protein
MVDKKDVRILRIRINAVAGVVIPSRSAPVDW